MQVDTDQQSDDELAVNIPAIGIYVRPNIDPDTLAGAILRAQRQGHDVFVAPREVLGPEAYAVTAQLGVTAINKSETSRDGHPRGVLATEAREVGYPGVIWQPDPSMRVDFERSQAECNAASTYTTEASQQAKVAATVHVLVAIPAYNEGGTIADVVTDSRLHADEVLVVDDGSGDDTAARAHEAGAKVIEHETNRGYGAALKTAFQEAHRSDAEHLVILDGDGQHDPLDIPTLVKTQQDAAAEVVIGSRFTPEAETNLPLYRRLGVGVVNLVTNFSIGAVQSSSRVRDTQCGFRAYNQTAIASLATDDSIGSNMGASTDILQHAHAHDYDIVEEPTTVDYDIEDANTHSPIRHGIMLIMNLVETIEQERPITAIGIPGIVVTLLGVAFAYWAVANYIATGTFPLGLALTAAFLGLIGVLACFSAVILHAVSTQIPDIPTQAGCQRQDQ